MAKDAELIGIKGPESMFGLLDQCLRNTQGYQVTLVAESAQIAVTRFAHNRIHQNVMQQNTRVLVRVLVGGTQASLVCNTLAPEQISDAIKQAAQIARRLPKQNYPSFPVTSAESGNNIEPGAENVAINDSSSHKPSYSFFTDTAHQTALDRAMIIGEVVQLARISGFEAYGTYKTTYSEFAVANTSGLHSYAPATSAFLKVLVESEVGSGYADQLSRNVASIDPVRVADTAIKKCKLNANQIELPPGHYAAVLEPNTVADLLRFIAINGCGAQQVIDERSFMTGRFGQQVTGGNVTILEDPNHPSCMPFPLDYDGLIARRVPLIVQGKAAGVVYDRHTASRVSHRISTGHAPDDRFSSDPLPNHIVMKPGSKTIEDLTLGLRSGVLVTRLHYTHCPDPLRVVATGTTRDGTFLVQNGEIVAAVRNLRLIQSVLDLLATIKEMGQPKTCLDWWGSNGMSQICYHVPSVSVDQCTFVGVAD